MISYGSRPVQGCFEIYLAEAQKNDQIPLQLDLFLSSNPNAIFPIARYGTHDHLIVPEEQLHRNLLSAILLSTQLVD